MWSSLQRSVKWSGIEEEEVWKGQRGWYFRSGSLNVILRSCIASSLTPARLDTSARLFIDMQMTVQLMEAEKVKAAPVWCKQTCRLLLLTAWLQPETETGRSETWQKWGMREGAWEQTARQEKQSGERDNPLLFIYSPCFQGTSQRPLSLNIEWTLDFLFVRSSRGDGFFTNLHKPLYKPETISVPCVYNFMKLLADMFYWRSTAFHVVDGFLQL